MQPFTPSTHYVIWLSTLLPLPTTSIWIWTCGLRVSEKLRLCIVIAIDGLYEKLSSISTAQLNEDRIAFVLPAFQFTPEEREICKSDDHCFNQLSSKLPTTKSELLKCIRSKVCQIANGFLPTHV